MKQFLQFVANIFDVPVSELSPETQYNSIPQWDSIMQLRLVMEIESKYGISIPIDIVPELDTLQKFYDQIKGS